MVEAAPPAPFVIAKAKLLLELLIIALDPPPQLCQIDQTIERGIFGQGGKPILRRLGFVFRPLDQKPLFSAQLVQQIIAMRRPHSSPGKARGEPIGGSLAPSDRLPRLARQAEGECLDRDWLMPSALQARLRSSATGSRLRRQGSLARRPHRGVGTDPRDAAQAESGDVRSQAG